MIGSVFLWIWVWVLGTFLALSTAVAFVIFNPLVDRQRRVVHWLCSLWGKGIMMVLVHIPLDFHGAEHLNGGPYVVVPNHESLADIIVLLARMPNFVFVARRVLFFWPPIALVMRLAGYIPAGREGEDAAIVNDRCRYWLDRGVHVLIFPEGSRTPDGQLKRFRQGPFLIAKQAGLKVLPLAIKGTGKIQPKNSLIYKFRGHVTITALPPFAVDGTPKEAAARARAMIAECLAAQDRQGEAAAA